MRVLLAKRGLGIVRGFHTEGRSSGAASFGRVRLEKGDNYLLLELAGKDPRATDTLVGIDGFRLTP